MLAKGWGQALAWVSVNIVFGRGGKVRPPHRCNPGFPSFFRHSGTSFGPYQDQSGQEGGQHAMMVAFSGPYSAQHPLWEVGVVSPNPARPCDGRTIDVFLGQADGRARRRGGAATPIPPRRRVRRGGFWTVPGGPGDAPRRSRRRRCASPPPERPGHRTAGILSGARSAEASCPPAGREACHADPAMPGHGSIAWGCSNAPVRPMPPSRDLADHPAPASLLSKAGPFSISA